MKIKLQLTVGQVIAILEEMPGTEYSGFIAMARSIEKQVEPQLMGTDHYTRWKFVRKVQRSGSREMVNVLTEYAELGP